jgi:hypothetical protein
LIAGGGIGATGIRTQAPLRSWVSPGAHGREPAMHSRPSGLTFRLLQHVPSAIEVKPAAHGLMTSVDFGHSDRSAEAIGLEQHTPLVVTFAGEQQAPLAVGIRPDAQHSGPTGTWKIGSHVFWSGAGASPAGQQTPVEVTLLARQQEPPAGA